MPTDKERKLPSTSRGSTGGRGEDAAALYLVRRGCAILARNWRANPGEVDIVAECPTGSVLPQQTLAFVEVRTRRGQRGLAEESISRRKAANMAAAAYSYLEGHGLDPERTPWRIDLIAISMSHSDITSINWVQGAVNEDMISDG